MKQIEISEDRSNNKTTSLLSPFIRYRLISEEQVLKKVLEKYELRDCEKFIQEIYWRTYWTVSYTHLTLPTMCVV